MAVIQGYRASAAFDAPTQIQIILGMSLGMGHIHRCIAASVLVVFHSWLVTTSHS